VSIWSSTPPCDMTHSFVTRLMHLWPDPFLCDTWCDTRVSPDVCVSVCVFDLCNTCVTLDVWHSMCDTRRVSHILYTYVGWHFAYYDTRCVTLDVSHRVPSYMSPEYHSLCLWHSMCHIESPDECVCVFDLCDTRVSLAVSIADTLWHSMCHVDSLLIHICELTSITAHMCMKEGDRDATGVASYTHGWGDISYT